MEEQNNDFKLLMKRLSITLVLFLMVLAYQFRYKGEFPNPFKSTLFQPSQVEEVYYDTVFVRAKDANMSKITLTYHLLINTDKMDEVHKYAFTRHKNLYLRNLIVLNIREQLHTQILYKISFDDIDAIPKYRMIVSDVVKANMNYPAETGIVIKSSDFEIFHDERVIEKMIYSATKVIEDLAKKEKKKTK